MRNHFFFCGSTINEQIVYKVAERIHQVSIDSNDLNTATYVARFQSEEFIKTKNIGVIK